MTFAAGLLSCPQIVALVANDKDRGGSGLLELWNSEGPQRSQWRTDGEGKNLSLLDLSSLGRL